jgi:hypothetical protein
MPPGETNVMFSDVEEDSSFSPPRVCGFRCLRRSRVGFDEIGDRNERASARTEEIRATSEVKFGCQPRNPTIAPLSGRITYMIVSQLSLLEVLTPL